MYRVRNALYIFKFELFACRSCRKIDNPFPCLINAVLIYAVIFQILLNIAGGSIMNRKRGLMIPLLPLTLTAGVLLAGGPSVPVNPRNSVQENLNPRKEKYGLTIPLLKLVHRALSQWTP